METDHAERQGFQWWEGVIVAIAVLGAGAISAGAKAIGASDAASAQESAAQQATDAQMSMFNTTQANLKPYMTTGADASGQLDAALPSLTAGVSMDQNSLMQTPGYQFNLSQGLKSTQNGATARGLGVSGAADKGAAAYATGLADSTYQSQFNNAVTNQTNTYNRLLGTSTLGANAAASLGTQGTATGTGIASNTIGAGNAAAAADNSIGSAVGTAANSAGGYYYANQLMKSSY